MIIHPLAWGLRAGTVATDSAAFERGFPASNLFDADVHRPTRFRGQWVVTGTDGEILGDFGTATIAADTYYSGQRMAIAAAAALNGASSNWEVWQDQSDSNFGRFVLNRTSGTAALDAPRILESALIRHLGFGQDARGAASQHAGYMASMGQDEVIVDLGAPSSATHSFVWGHNLSPAANVQIGMGDASGTWTETAKAADAVTHGAMMIDYGGAVRRRYVQLLIQDQLRSTHQRTELKVWSHGPVFDFSDPAMFDVSDYESASWQRQHESRSTVTRTIDGHPTFSEHATGEQFRVTFGAAPGLYPSQAYGLEDLLATLGRSGWAFVALDPDDEPHRETRLCYFTEVPPLSRLAMQSKAGRWSVDLAFRVEAP